jgi:hypothetical protein
MQAGNVVLDRLSKLVAKGYVVRWEEAEKDTLRLKHPRAPDLTLFSDGRIWVLTWSPDDWIAADSEASQHRFQSFVFPDDWIAADNETDARRFKSFVARVPKPTMLQSFKAMILEDVWIRVMVWTFVTLFTVVVILFVGWATRHLGWWNR